MSIGNEREEAGGLGDEAQEAEGQEPGESYESDPTAGGLGRVVLQFSCVTALDILGVHLLSVGAKLQHAGFDVSTLSVRRVRSISHLFRVTHAHPPESTPLSFTKSPPLASYPLMKSCVVLSAKTHWEIVVTSLFETAD